MSANTEILAHCHSHGISPSTNLTSMSEKIVENVLAVSRAVLVPAVIIISFQFTTIVIFDILLQYKFYSKIKQLTRPDNKRYRDFPSSIKQ